jgi:apolipoprotein D and lipocalin family protein
MKLFITFINTSIFLSLLIGLPTCVLAADVTTVPYVELQRYLGHWFEIASIPSWFQKPCVGGTTADYRLLDDGSISVVNSCLKVSDDVLISQGRAFVADTETNAKLLVSFVNIQDKWLFFGDYWILGLGNNYEYAVVGESTRNYGWILSRTCSLPQETIEVIINLLTEQGYDLTRFAWTDQSSAGCIQP